VTLVLIVVLQIDRDFMEVINQYLPHVCHRRNKGSSNAGQQTLQYVSLIYDIYLTAVGLAPGGSSTSHIYTQTVRVIQRQENNREKGKLRSAGRAPSCELYPGICSKYS
jgi:hypothetical protein